MAQRSIYAQPTLPEQKRVLLNYSWMQHFFTEDQSAQSRPIIELQQRALWIALALLLQSANEIDHRIYSFLGPFSSFVSPALFLGSFYAIWMAMCPAKPHKERQSALATPQQPRL